MEGAVHTRPCLERPGERDKPDQREQDGDTGDDLGIDPAALRKAVITQTAEGMQVRADDTCNDLYGCSSQSVNQSMKGSRLLH